MFLLKVKQDDIFRFVTEGILLTVVSIFGLIGNSMSIIVLTRASGVVRQGGASFSKLLRGLATFDALFLFVAIISFGFPQLSKWYTRNVFLYIMPIVFGLLHTFRVGSVYVTLAVTFERFHAIICPLKHFFWKKYLLPASVCVAVVYNIPKYFEMEMQVYKLFLCFAGFYVYLLLKQFVFILQPEETAEPWHHILFLFEKKKHFILLIKFNFSQSKKIHFYFFIMPAILYSQKYFNC